MQLSLHIYTPCVYKTFSQVKEMWLQGGAGWSDRPLERRSWSGLLGGGVLGDSLGALRHGVLGQLTGEQQPDGGLDLPTGDGGTLVVVGQTRGLRCNTFENVVDKGVHDGHSLGGDTSVRVDLLEHLVNVDAVALLPPALLLLVSLGDAFLGFASLLGSLPGGFRGHGVSVSDAGSERSVRALPVAPGARVSEVQGQNFRFIAAILAQRYIIPQKTSTDWWIRACGLVA